MKTLFFAVAALLGVVWLADNMANSDVRWLESQPSENREAILKNRTGLKGVPADTLVVLEDGGTIVSLASPYRDGRIFVRRCKQRELKELRMLFNQDFAGIRDIIPPGDPDYAVTLAQFQRCGK